ncbi:VCBS repeat-containing protein [Bradyrhizobium diazoefficiens]|uniref:SpvB/TcaC N-terminal domain-containing protein n=2 Tax=Bradyrhizobium diazoefficiens TaxID=1355477 RepID=UPI001B8C19FE|nr:SpvB/TcaC N-terminal domain-containing protein [Bradyrhizobium diazoefficiens]MBR0861206.1 VCBS repeat-containing protein [Bradyrhizobium diazoefficiens]MBR0922076.1 VCBS repeat-containing protein [Bradyrhizobium diazoefficiens]
MPGREQAKPAANAASGDTFRVSAPQISMPKGGGAIRGIGEKFAANPTTGTGSITVPIATSPGRSDFGPQLVLLYDSGTGNGPFGFGWSLSVPSITRKTDKGLPQYNDSEESDVFILSGSEDLVPEYEKDASGALVIQNGRPVVHDKTRTVGGVVYAIRRYRPRIEGLFARIERWTRQFDGDVHWRSVSKDNVLALYGKDDDARIADPEDPRRIFSWLICETRDDKGNAVLYDYKREDGAGVDLVRACERNRGDRNDVRRTANRYLKRIRYGNRKPLLDGAGRRPQLLSELPPLQLQDAGWMFETVFDYGEHDIDAPEPDDAAAWSYRGDPFSSYRSGFEIRTTRLCRRVLMFHHVPDLVSGAKGYDGIVRSTDFGYSHQLDPTSARNAVYTFLRTVTQTGYRRITDGYDKRSLPPVAFDYTQPIVQDTVEDVDATSLENLPIGVDDAAYRWTDLHGEGIPGVLTEQAEAWFYKRNLSPISNRPVKFAPLELVAAKPAATLAGGHAQFMDLAGDGLPDLVVLDGPVPGLYEHDEDEGWQRFRPFTSRLEHNMRDPNLKFVDLDGDGHADVLITEDDALVWHPSLAEAGFGPARRVAQARDEEKGPRLVFADSSQSIYLADLDGDGLTDLVRIRNGEVCYWPNLGYGRFGAKVTMDNAPRFDNPDQFDHARIRLADIDGSGTTDIIYLHRDGVRLYFNQSGNGWSEPKQLKVFPRVDDLVSIVTTDLLGNGTACLVWSSPLSGDARRPMRYVNLMGGSKPHLLVKTANNLGAETVVRYVPSTKFYLQDRRDGKPWITRLPFPVHVVERVETHDRISRNRFVTHYAYHHGYFDGEEREFRGFGMVEQWDTEELAALTGDGTLPPAGNEDAASHVPPVLTRTWYHTGAYLGRDHVSDFFAGLLDATDKGEYYREPGLTDVQARALLLPDTVLPPGLTPEEEREACRALKGSMLRQEIYALDGTPKEAHPYMVSEQSFGVRLEQPRGGNRHAVLFAHPREVITYHYERNPADPRIQHALTLEVDRFGNLRKEATIGYGRRQPDLALPLQVDRDKQTRTLITYTENSFSNAIDDALAFPEAYRTPLPSEMRTFELTGYAPTGGAGRFQSADFVQLAGGVLAHIFDSEIDYEKLPTAGRQRRLIEHVRTLYRADNLTALLPLDGLEPRALSGESYKLAFTPGLLAQIFQRDGQPLLPIPADVLGGAGADRGGYLASQQLKADGRFPGTDPDDRWWVPAGRVFLSPGDNDTAAQELAYARGHFFMPHRSRDPFHSNAVSTESLVSYDAYDLLMVETRDALDNRVTVGERRLDGTLDPAKPGNDYRVLQPACVMDPNRNRTQVAIDTLGLVVGTAVLGKPEENLGDSLESFAADLTEAVILDHLANPLTDPNAILGRAGTRLVYDLFAYQRSQNAPEPEPVVVYTLARETHDADLGPGEVSRIQHSFSYSDGFGREIQKKVQAEPGPLAGNGATVNPRWVSSGWTIYNNKGKPVRRYEPFFSSTHRFDFGVQMGVSPILFYDPVERVVATLHPNHTYEKVVFDTWRQIIWDVNDTTWPPMNPGDPPFDPKNDADVGSYFSRLPDADYLPTWHDLRIDPAKALLAWPDVDAQGQALPDNAKRRIAEQRAAAKAAIHAGTPTVAYLDTLGRSYLTLADNGPDPAQPGRHQLFATRVEFDIEGNQRAVRDAIEQAGDAQGRIVMRYAYDMLGNRIRQLSMEAGARWMLNDVVGKAIRAWDGRGHTIRTDYDPLRRPLRVFATGADAANPNQELLTERLVYGEQHPEAELRNLRGKLYFELDQAGSLATEANDFKGNPLSASRRLTGGTRYRQAVDWAAVNADHIALPENATALLGLAALDAALAPRLEADIYASGTSYDALNRPVTLTTPHTPAMQASVIRPGYNEANLLERVDANLRGITSNAQPMWTPFVTNIDYDAKGQRQRIDYGNGASTLYDYDPSTFRLIRLFTRRNAVDFPSDCPLPPPTGWPGCQVQNLHYSYDPVGNVTSIRDDAQQTIYFRNKRVEPSAEYIYDALYRLVEATGREHLGQVGGKPVPHSHSDAPRVGIDWSANDGNAMGTYVERYLYDAVGNFREMQHRGSDPVNSGWTRACAYDEPSLIEDGTGGTLLKTGNRMSSTTVGNGSPVVARYVHDAHGNIVRMPHLGGVDPAPNMQWDYEDQLHQVDLGGGGTAYYVYDAKGQRVRKVWEKSASLIEERVYFDGFEIFRRHQGAQRLERETLHVMDDEQRVALVETRTLDTAGNDPALPQLIRYQFGSHLRSSNIEMDDQARIISYEEYTPYGSTSYQAVRDQNETPKRYRYTGKERDEESGFYYHGGRYYLAWLGRWLSADPSGLADGINLYRYSNNSPLVYTDQTGSDSEDEILKAGAAKVEKFKADVETAAKDYDIASAGLTVADLKALINVESSGDPNSVTGSYRGLFQLSKAQTYDATEFSSARRSRFNKSAPDKKFAWTDKAILDPTKNIRYGTFVVLERIRQAKESIGRKDKLVAEKAALAKEATSLEDRNTDLRKQLRELNELKGDKVTQKVKDDKKTLRKQIGEIPGLRIDIKNKQDYNEKNLKEATSIEAGNKLLEKFMKDNPGAAAYLLHQQGITGLRNILLAPKANISAAQKGNLTDAAKKTVTTNEQFVKFWVDRFNKAKSFVK